MNLNVLLIRSAFQGAWLCFVEQMLVLLLFLLMICASVPDLLTQIQWNRIFIFCMCILIAMASSLSKNSFQPLIGLQPFHQFTLGTSIESTTMIKNGEELGNLTNLFLTLHIELMMLTPWKLSQKVALLLGVIRELTQRKYVKSQTVDFVTWLGMISIRMHGLRYLPQLGRTTTRLFST